MTLSLGRESTERSGIPFVDFFFVRLLKAGSLQIAVGMLEHIERFGNHDRTADLLGPFDPLRNQGLLSSAIAMTFGGRRRHQISEVFENPERGNPNRAALVICTVG